MKNVILVFIILMKVRFGNQHVVVTVLKEALRLELIPIFGDVIQKIVYLLVNSFVEMVNWMLRLGSLVID
jgi:hypothetical protein